MLAETIFTEIPDLIRKGGKEGYYILYKRYAASLYGLIFRLVNDEDLAEACFLKTFTEIIKNINSYDESKLSFFTWASQTARMICRNAIENNIPAKLAVSFRHADDCREVLKLVFWSGHSPEETARIMNISVDDVKSGLREALKNVNLPL